MDFKLESEDEDADFDILIALKLGLDNEDDLRDEDLKGEEGRQRGEAGDKGAISRELRDSVGVEVPLLISRSDKVSSIS